MSLVTLGHFQKRTSNRDAFLSERARAILAAPAMLSPQPKSARCCHAFALQTAKFWRLKLRANNVAKSFRDNTEEKEVKCSLLTKRRTGPIPARELGAGFFSLASILRQKRGV
jgi:hypothetical protein